MHRCNAGGPVVTVLSLLASVSHNDSVLLDCTVLRRLAQSLTTALPMYSAVLLMCVTAVLLCQPAVAQVAGNAPAGVSGSGSSVFAGSMVSVRPTVSALALNKAAEPMWNPYFGTQVTLAPRVSLSRRASLSAMLIINREFTQSGSTTYAGETTLSDTFLSGSFTVLSHPPSGLRLAANAQLRLPSSKASLGRTMIAGLLGGASLSWSRKFKLFGVQQAVSLIGIGRFGRIFHQHAEASTEQPWLAECGALPTGCGRFSHSGSRNNKYRGQAIVSLSYRPVSKLSLSFQVGSFYDLLYDLPAAKTQGFEVPLDPTDPSGRGIAFYIVTLSYQPIRALAVALGTETANAHLAPDSTFRTPFFNRNTTIFLSLRAFPAALL